MTTDQHVRVKSQPKPKEEWNYIVETAKQSKDLQEHKKEKSKKSTKPKAPPGRPVYGPHG